MIEVFADGKTLSNGIYVQRKIYWADCEVAGWPLDKPWLATINVGSWHYSSRGNATKEEAIKDLFEYMQEQIKAHKDQLEFQNNRLKELTEFLEKYNTN
jgi:hypothetical protein